MAPCTFFGEVSLLGIFIFRLATIQFSEVSLIVNAAAQLSKSIRFIRILSLDFFVHQTLTIHS